MARRRARVVETRANGHLGDYVPFKDIVFWDRRLFYSAKAPYYYAQAYSMIDYLRRGAVCRRWHGYATCRLCSQSGRELGDADITDGSWIWPEGLPHYLEQHAVRPPEPFLCHLRERGFRSGGPIVPAEQTVSRLAPALLRGLERIEDKNGDKNGNAGAIRFRRTGPAGARDLVLGIEVDLTTGCFRIEYNEAALIAQRQQVERMMNPPWWRKLVRQIFG